MCGPGRHGAEIRAGRIWWGPEHALSIIIPKLRAVYIQFRARLNMQYTVQDMAETLIEFPGGGRAKVTGTPQEIAEVLRLAGMAATKAPHAQNLAETRLANAKGTRAGPMELISELKSVGFFAVERSIGEVQAKLRAGGNIYALTSLSPALIRLVRRRVLGRVRGARGRWVYVER